MFNLNLQLHQLQFRFVLIVIGNGLVLLFAIICVEEIRNDVLASVSRMFGFVFDSTEVTYKGLINKLSLSSAGTTVSPGLAIF